MHTAEANPVMKKFLRVTAAFMLGMLFAACEDYAEEQPSIEDEELPSDEEGEEDLPDTVVYDDEHTLEALQIDPFWRERIEEYPEDVLHIVLTTCIALENEYVSDVILDLMNRHDASEISAQHLVEVSVFTVCPEYESNYEAYLEAKLKRQ